RWTCSQCKQAFGFGVQDSRPMISDESTPTADLPMAARQRAVGATTKIVAPDLAQPQATAPEWSESEWRIARAVVAMHGVSGLMAAATRWPGPAGWQG